jgi:hypothetical protein
MALIKWLQGKKTYALVALAVIVSGLRAQNLIDDDLYKGGMALLAMLGLGTVRAAIASVVRNGR